ncbi:hypothetical protein CGRA01v4_11992 [Colletotrichum graminicola]|nr:hypothetical protein CGRA01v4_11992 [Colletotrichum graminicola]
MFQSYGTLPQPITVSHLSATVCSFPSKKAIRWARKRRGGGSRRTQGW